MGIKLLFVYQAHVDFIFNVVQEAASLGCLESQSVDVDVKYLQDGHVIYDALQLCRWDTHLKLLQQRCRNGACNVACQPNAV